jgi:hypothetical protein
MPPEVIFKTGKNNPPRPVARCPFGCQVDVETAAQSLNEAGFCKHCIGFTRDGFTFVLRESHSLKDEATFERLSKQTRPVEDTHTVVESVGPDKRVYYVKGEAPYPVGTYEPTGKPIKRPQSDVDEMAVELEKVRKERDRAIQETVRLREEMEAANEARLQELREMSEQEQEPVGASQE